MREVAACYRSWFSAWISVTSVSPRKPRMWRRCRIVLQIVAVPNWNIYLAQMSYIPGKLDRDESSAARNPRKTACVFETENISYGQLDRSTTSLARWFLRNGCKPGDRIAVHWPNSIETVMLLFACFKAGMIAVPVNVRMKGHEVAYVLQHS